MTEFVDKALEVVIETKRGHKGRALARGDWCPLEGKEETTGDFSPRVLTRKATWGPRRRQLSAVREESPP